MSESFEVLYNKLGLNIELLKKWALQLKNENDELRKEIDKKDNELRELKDKLNEVEQKYIMLKDAAMLVKIEKNDITSLKHRINNLVREIDECMALITKE